MPAPVRWGVIGSTSRVARLAVLPALATAAGCEVVATASTSRPSAATHGDDYQAVLDDPAVEAVYIPLPNHLHREWVERAAAAGKHVLCEKPLARTASEALAMADACAAGGVVLSEAYMTPFHPRSRALLRLVNEGRLGRLLFARTSFTGLLEPADDHRWRWDAGGGALLDVGIYCIAPLLAAFGREPVSVAASAHLTAPVVDGGVDASCSGWLDFGHGAAAAFACSFEAPELQRTEFIGTSAAVALERAFTPGPHDVSLVLRHRNGTTEDLGAEAGPGDDPYRLMVEHVSSVIRGDAAPERTPADSIALLALLDRLRAAAGMPAAA